MKKTHRTHETETSLRDTFYIIKGQYSPRRGIESYDPESSNTHEWYQAIDKCTHLTISCGSDFKRVLNGIKRHVKYYKTREAFHKWLYENSTEDYYRTHYLGLPPYTQREKDAMAKEGVYCLVSRPMKELYEQVYTAYGDYYYDEVEEAVEQAYREDYAETRKTTRGSLRPRKSKAVKKPVLTPPEKTTSKKPVILKKTPKREEEVLIIEEEPTPKTTRRPKVLLKRKRR